jgi:hypothetical protein
MVMRRLALSAASVAVFLSACSGGDAGDAASDGKVSASEAAEAAANMPKPEPGLYRTTITMIGIDVPGMGQNMAGHGGGMTTTSEYCLTEQDVAEGYQEMMKRGQDGSCTYERFNAGDGRLDAVMLCKTESGDARMEMTGTATATGSEFDAKMAMDLDGMGNGTMRFKAKHERIGDCP